MPTGNEVKMYMENRLPCTGIIIGDNSETAFTNPLFPGDTGGNRIDVADQLMVGRVEIEGIHKMLSGNEQNMQRSNRRDILNDNDLFIFENLLCRDLPLENPAENTIVHRLLLFVSIVQDLFTFYSFSRSLFHADKKFPVPFLSKKRRFRFAPYFEAELFSQRTD